MNGLIMQIKFICINIGVYFIVLWATADLKTLSDSKLQRIKKQWDSCCEKHLCIQNSCYLVEGRSATWAIARQRCQALYPDWPYVVDLFRIQNEEDIPRLLTIFPKSVSRRSLWTSGTRCPKAGKDETVLVTSWVSTDHLFPEWLEIKLNETTPDLSENSEGCKFLVMHPPSITSEVRFDFQDQRARHKAICEFSFPGALESTTPEETSKTDDYKDTDEVDRTNVTTDFDTTPTSKMSSIKSEILSQAESLYSTQLPKSTEFWSTKDFRDITSSQATDVTYEPEDKEEELLTTKVSQFCKGKTVFGIKWPDAYLGEIVNQSCPEGMIGYAQWTCSELTLEYTPDKPHVQDCKHVWITDLEKDVVEGGDAIIISQKLADQTKNQNLSHGDITALVDLSSKVINLYTEQYEDEKEDSLQGNKHVSYNFTGSMVTSISNILRSEIKTAWEVLPKVHRTREASKILRLVTGVGSRLGCVKTSESRLQYTVTSENIGLQTFIINNSSYEDSGDDKIIFPRPAPGVETNSSLTLPSKLELKSYYSSCKNYKTAVGVIYNHVGDFLKDENTNGYTTHVVTKVISFSLTNNTKTLKLPKMQEVTVTLQHLMQNDIRLGLLMNPRCMFWNFSKDLYGQWDNSGCHRLSSNLTHTVCICDHLTNFAVLMDVNDNIGEDEVHSLLTYICCGISSVCLILTIACFLSIKSLHGRRSIITGNLCLSLLITNVLILFGLDQTYSKVLCASIAGFLHFWILSAFFWMLVEGYHLYRMVILVFQRGADFSVKCYYAFAYGSPLLIVGISVSIRTDGYGGKNNCWLSTNKGLMWSFVGPVCAIILINIIIFILTLRSASSVRIKREQTTMKKIKSWTRGSLSVMCLLGLTWCLGLFYMNKHLHVISYIFIVLNGSQGVFIFVFHILLNEKMKALFFTNCIKRKQDHWRKNPPQTSSKQLHSKTSSRTSILSNGYASNNTQVSSLRTITSDLSRTQVIGTNLVTENNKSINAFQSNANYRKPKVMHTNSEKVMHRFPLSEPYKTRSQSNPEEYSVRRSSYLYNSKNNTRYTTNLSRYNTDSNGHTASLPRNEGYSIHVNNR